MVYRDGRVLPWPAFVHLFSSPRNAPKPQVPCSWPTQARTPSKRQWLLQSPRADLRSHQRRPRCCSRGKCENSRQRQKLLALRRLPDRFAIRFRFRQRHYNRKLQHGGALACHKSRKEDDAPRWKLQRIVMFVGTIRIDSPETCGVFPHLLGREKSQGVIALNVAVEYKLRSGREADRQLWVSYLCKSACNGIAEYGRHQLVANFGLTAFHVL